MLIHMANMEFSDELVFRAKRDAPRRYPGPVGVQHVDALSIPRNQSRVHLRNGVDDPALQIQVSADDLEAVDAPRPYGRVPNQCRPRAGLEPVRNGAAVEVRGRTGLQVELPAFFGDGGCVDGHAGDSDAAVDKDARDEGVQDEQREAKSKQTRLWVWPWPWATIRVVYHRSR